MISSAFDNFSSYGSGIFRLIESVPSKKSENMSVAKRGGTVAKSARDAYEKETKKIAVSKNNSIKYKYIEDKKLINKKRD